MPALAVPPTNADGSLRYYTEAELEEIDLQQRGTGEEHDHVRDEMSAAGSKSTRRYSCVWEHRYAAALVMVGAAKWYNDSDGRLRISRLLPDCHPGRDDFNWAATGVNIFPFQHDGTTDDVPFGQPMPKFERADLEVVYELVPFELLEDSALAFDTEYRRYVTEPGHPGADIASSTSYTTMAGGVLNYANATGTGPPTDSSIPFGIGFTETYTTKKFVWRRVPEDLWGPGTILTTRVKGNGTPGNRGMLGSLNLTEFLHHPELTLKLDAVEERLLPDPIGVGYAWDLVFVCQEKAVPYGHLGYWFPDTTNSGLSGYYQALRPGLKQTKTAAQLFILGDQATLFHIREFANLFIVGAV